MSRFRLVPEVTTLNDKPRVMIISWLWWNVLYRS